MNDKIKDLLAKAYKTDSIAKNKWRIENREHLREQRKKELKELMEKDNTMSNNEQSSVESLFQKLWDTPKDKFTWYAILEEHKAMHKSEIIWAHGIKMKGVNNHKCVSGEQYYNETFGGNNEQ